MIDLDHFQEEQALGKAYDGRLMLFIEICYTLLTLIALRDPAFGAATDLARPYLIKIAIDDHILGSNISYVEVGPE